MDEGEWLQTEGYVQIRYQNGIFYCEGGESLEEVAQSKCGCLNPGGVQGQAGGHSERSGLVKGQGRVAGTR